MKVNTDGVLLGAWALARVISSNPIRVLDIGTGTGVIALMMAQGRADATIDAIDIDEAAYLQAKENFTNSKWAERLSSIHSSLQDFSAEHLYDVIVCNPPYFVDDYKTGNEQKNIAKHSTALNYAELVSGIERLLTVDGQVFLVLPVFNIEVIKPMLLHAGLFITNRADAIAVSGRNPYLSLLQIQKTEKAFTPEAIIIQNEKGEFTEQYKTLTRDFYLKF